MTVSSGYLVVISSVVLDKTHIRPQAGFPNCHMSAGQGQSLWHSNDLGEQPTAGAVPPLVIERWRLHNRVAKWGTMSDTSQGEGWWLAGDGKWYPPETPAPPRVTSTDATPTPQTS